jgi:hypothetical protein
MPRLRLKCDWWHPCSTLLPRSTASTFAPSAPPPPCAGGPRVALTPTPSALHDSEDKYLHTWDITPRAAGRDNPTLEMHGAQHAQGVKGAHEGVREGVAHVKLRGGPIEKQGLSRGGSDLMWTGLGARTHPSIRAASHLLTHQRTHLSCSLCSLCSSTCCLAQGRWGGAGGRVTRVTHPRWIAAGGQESRCQGYGKVTLHHHGLLRVSSVLAHHVASAHRMQVCTSAYASFAGQLCSVSLSLLTARGTGVWGLALGTALCQSASETAVLVRESPRPATDA